MMVYVGLQYLHDGLCVLSQTELIDPFTPVFPLFEAEYQEKGRLTETWGCKDGP